MKVIPFRLIPDRELRRLEGILEPVTAVWRKKWLGSDDAAILVDAARAETLSETEEGELWDWQWGANGRCLMRMDTRTKMNWLAKMLRAERSFESETPMIKELWLESASDLVNAIVTAITEKPISFKSVAGRTQVFPSDWMHPGSGIVKLGLTGEFGPISLFVQGDVPAVGAADDREAHGFHQTTSLRDALGGRSLAAEMILASEELALGELLSLRTGDVIALSQRCDQPVAVKIKDTGVTLVGYVGQRNGSKSFIVESAASRSSIYDENQ